MPPRLSHDMLRQTKLLLHHPNSPQCNFFRFGTNTKTEAICRRIEKKTQESKAVHLITIAKAATYCFSLYVELSQRTALQAS